MKPLGPQGYDLKSLSPDQFEELVFLLAHAENPDVVPVRAKDQGLDARLPTRTGRATARGWQAKRFTQGIKWDQCQESVRRALSFWRPPRITFGFAHDLSATEQDGFRKNLIDLFPELRLDYWSGSELQRRMRDQGEGERAARYFFSDLRGDLEAMMRVAATGGQLDAAEQALARLGVINKFLQGDPHFRYQVGFGEPDSPSQTPPPGTVMSVEVVIEGARIELHAQERYRGAAAKHGPEGALVFDDEEAARAGREALNQVDREGRAVTLEPGARMRMDRLPSLFAQLFAETNDEAEQSIQVSAGRRPLPAERVLAVLVSAGEAQAAVDLRPVEPPEGWSGAVSGGFGGLEIYIALRRHETEPERGQLKMTWDYKMGVGSTMEQLIALEVVLAIYEGQTVSVRDPATNTVVVEEAKAEDTSAEGDGFAGRLELLRALAELEAWTGIQFEPPPSWQKEDAESLFAALAVIRKPLMEKAEEIRIKLTYKPEAMPEDPGEVHQFASVQQLAINLFGREVELGQRMIHLPRGRLTEIDEEAKTAVVVSEPGRGASIQLFPPGEPTPFWPGPGQRAGEAPASEGPETNE